MKIKVRYLFAALHFVAYRTLPVYRLPHLLGRHMTASLFSHCWRDSRIGQSLEIILAHFTIPVMSHKICSELLVLIRQIITSEVRDEDVRHEHSNNTADGRDDECPSLSQVCLDGCKCLCPDSSPGLPNGGRNTIASSTDGCRIAFGRDEA